MWGSSTARTCPSLSQPLPGRTGAERQHWHPRAVLLLLGFPSLAPSGAEAELAVTAQPGQQQNPPGIQDQRQEGNSASTGAPTDPAAASMCKDPNLAPPSQLDPLLLSPAAVLGASLGTGRMEGALLLPTNLLLPSPHVPITSGSTGSRECRDGFGWKRS